MEARTLRASRRPGLSRFQRERGSMVKYIYTLGTVVAIVLFMVAWGGDTSAHAQTAEPTTVATPTGSPATPEATQVISPTVTAESGQQSATGAFVQLGNVLNRDQNASATDQNIAYGSTTAGGLSDTWATWAEKQGNT